MANIGQSVGERGFNRDVDVRTVQTLVNQHAHALGLASLQVNGKADKPTVRAIKLFQRRAVRLSSPDGRIDADGRTWRTLNGPAGKVLAAITATKADLSGAAWWHANQARFPNRSAVSDLAPGFSAKVDAFLAALRKAGATVHVSATRRNKTRAYLMHFSWKVAKGIVQAEDVPAETGCTIIWDHGSDIKSRQAAQQMFGLFNLKYLPSLTSRHIPGLAVDMTISWNGSIKVRDAAGKDVLLSSPSDGANTALHAVGASYGVVKLVVDPPHWSDNGH